MKAIGFGDLHAHMYQEFAEKHPVFGNTRMQGLLTTFDYMSEYCFQNGISLVLFAGDMFHKRVVVDQTVRNLIYDKIKQMSDEGLHIIMIPGNHDQVDNTDFPQHSLHEFQDISNVVILDNFEKYYYNTTRESICIYPTPYSKNVQMIKDKITEYAEDTKENGCPSILLGHFGIDGATVGKRSYSLQGAFGMGDLYPDVFDFGIFGHYHKAQYLGKTKNFAYTGSPLQHSFHDEGSDTGFVVIDTDKKTMELIEIPSPKFITVTDPETDLKALVGNYIRLQIPADKVDSVQEEMPEELYARIEPQTEYTTDQRVAIDQKMSNAEIVVEYCKTYNLEATDIMLEILREVE